MRCSKCGKDMASEVSGCDSCGADIARESLAEAAPEYAGFWIRFCAAFIDGIITIAINAPLVWLWGEGSVAVDISTMITGMLYYTLFYSSEWQATPGKRALGLIVTDLQGRRISFWRALGRYFAEIISTLVLCIGFIMIAFTEKKQGLHDKIAGTLVLRKKAY